MATVVATARAAATAILLIMCAFPIVSDAQTSATVDASKASVTKSPSWTCTRATRKVDKQEKKIAKTLVQSEQASGSLATCGSKPACDGYKRDVDLLTSRKATQDKRLAELRAAADAACAKQS